MSDQAPVVDKKGPPTSAELLAILSSVGSPNIKPGGETDLATLFDNNLVILENLPCLFTDATLVSLAEHVPKKGKILASGVMEYPGHDLRIGYVSFEKKKPVIYVHSLASLG